MGPWKSTSSWEDNPPTPPIRRPKILAQPSHLESNTSFSYNSNTNTVNSGNNNNNSDSSSSSSPKIESKRNSRISNPCLRCREAHARCSTTRPCARCISLGLAHDCNIAPSKRRKSKKKKTEDAAGTTSSSALPAEPAPASQTNFPSPLDVAHFDTKQQQQQQQSRPSLPNDHDNAVSGSGSGSGSGSLLEYLSAEPPIPHRQSLFPPMSNLTALNTHPWSQHRHRHRHRHRHQQQQQQHQQQQQQPDSSNEYDDMGEERPPNSNTNSNNNTTTTTNNNINNLMGLAATAPSSLSIEIAAEVAAMASSSAAASSEAVTAIVQVVCQRIAQQGSVHSVRPAIFISARPPYITSWNKTFVEKFGFAERLKSATMQMCEVLAPPVREHFVQCVTSMTNHEMTVEEILGRNNRQILGSIAPRPNYFHFTMRNVGMDEHGTIFEFIQDMHAILKDLYTLECVVCLCYCNC